MKFSVKPFSKGLQGVGQRPTTLPLPLVGGSQKETSDRGGRARKGDSHGSGR